MPEALALPEGTPWWGYLLLIALTSGMRLAWFVAERKFPAEPDDGSDASDGELP